MQCCLYLVYTVTDTSRFKMLMRKNYQGIPGNKENIVPCTEEDTDVLTYVEKKGTEQKYPF